MGRYTEDSITTLSDEDVVESYLHADGAAIVVRDWGNFAGLTTVILKREELVKLIELIDKGEE